MKHFPFKIFSKGGKPYIEVEYRGEKKEFVRGFSFASTRHVLTFPILVPRRDLLNGPPQNERDC